MWSQAGIRNQQSQMEDLTHRAEKLEEYTNGCKYETHRMPMSIAQEINMHFRGTKEILH